MTSDEAGKLLREFKAGDVDLPTVLRAFQSAPFESLEHTTVDHHRALRKGVPEVVFGSGKTAGQIVQIARAILKRDGRVLITRVQFDKAKAVCRGLPKSVYHEAAGLVVVEKRPLKPRDAEIAVVSAGTSDFAVAEEAAVTAAFLGNRVLRVNDVGVAGLHRLLARLEELQRADVLVVVAGMEGALPSVVAGLVDRPVIAVPTSVGYGAAFHGLAALLGMLTSCGSGVTVVNIDNGFGAAYAANQICSLKFETRA